MLYDNFFQMNTIYVYGEDYQWKNSDSYSFQQFPNASYF